MREGLPEARLDRFHDIFADGSHRLGIGVLVADVDRGMQDPASDGSEPSRRGVQARVRRAIEAESERVLWRRHTCEREVETGSAHRRRCFGVRVERQTETARILAEHGGVIRRVVPDAPPPVR